MSARARDSARNKVEARSHRTFFSPIAVAIKERVLVTAQRGTEERPDGTGGEESRGGAAVLNKLLHRGTK
jgi:hypothetical protein